MKRFLALAGMLSLMACSDDMNESSSVSNIETITMTAKDFIPDAATRTTIEITPQGADFKWAANDTVGIFPQQGAQAYFPMISGEGTNSAIFSGGGWALRTSAKYAAYYPYDFYNRDLTRISVSYKGQTQTGNATTGHMSNYDYLSASAVAPQNGNAKFTFEHLGCLVQLKLTIPVACNLNRVVLESNEKIFAQSATVDLGQNPAVMHPTDFSRTFNLLANEISFSKEGEVGTFYLMLPPADYSKKQIQAKCVTAEGLVYDATLSMGNMKPGYSYAYAATLSPEPKEFYWFPKGKLSIITYPSIESLKVIREIDAQDIRDILRLCGRIPHTYGDVKSQLKTLDLSEAYILKCQTQNDDWYVGYSTDFVDYQRIPADNWIHTRMFFGRDLSLTKIYIPDHTENIGEEAFCESRITEIELPASLRSIGDRAFKDARLKKIVVPESVETIGYNAFVSQYLEEIDIRAHLTEIILTSIFEGENLKIVRLPETVKSLKFQYSYENLGNVQEIYCRAVTPPTLTNVSFPSACKIYVPAASLDAYKAAPGWKNYADRIYAMP